MRGMPPASQPRPVPPTWLQLYMLRATALLPHTRYSDSEWRAFAQLSAHQVGAARAPAAQAWASLACTVADSCFRAWRPVSTAAHHRKVHQAGRVDNDC